MREEYDFSNSKPNPYTKLLKKEVKIKIDEDALFISRTWHKSLESFIKILSTATCVTVCSITGNQR